MAIYVVLGATNVCRLYDLHCHWGIYAPVGDLNVPLVSNHVHLLCAIFAVSLSIFPYVFYVDASVLWVHLCGVWYPRYS